MVLSVNLMSPTIEQVVSKMKRSHLSLLDLLLERLNGANAPMAARHELLTRRKEQAEREADEFNAPDAFQAATNAALLAQRRALGMLATAQAWEHEEGDVARNMRLCSDLCVKVGLEQLCSACMHACISTSMRAYMSTCMDACTCMSACIHACIGGPRGALWRVAAALE